MPAPDPTTALEPALDALRAGERRWADTGLRARADLLRELVGRTQAAAQDWVRAACAYKRLPESSPLSGEEWISGPWAFISYAQALAATLDALAAGKDPLDGCRVSGAPGGRTAVRVLPYDTWDKLLLSGFSAQVWTAPGVTADDLHREVGLAQRTPAATRGTALVLGAGNITAIAPLDVLHQLHAENRVVVLKLNPITDALAPVWRDVFAPYLQAGLVRIVTGDAATGSALAHHPQVSAIHLTGSTATHDAIVYGTGPDGEQARAADRPVLDKPVTAELGGVSPVIVVPGRWSAADLTYQARHLATQRLHNSGHNCVATQVVYLSSDWPQKDAFLAALRTALQTAPARPVYYPGADAAISGARGAHTGAQDLTGGRTLLTGLDPHDAAESAFSTEYFAPVLAVAELPGGAADFLPAAVAAANENLTGTLGANIVIDPATRRTLGGALEAAVADLRYGTIGVNAWTGLGFLTPRAGWGAFPGHPRQDIQSGNGTVHNALLLPHIERTVLSGPFRPAPRSLVHGEAALTPVPPWFVHNRTADVTGRRLTAFAARPRWAALPGIFASALRG